MLEAIPLDAELKVGSLLHRMPVSHRSNTQVHQRDCGGKNKKNDDDILLINHLIYDFQFTISVIIFYSYLRLERMMPFSFLSHL